MSGSADATLRRVLGLGLAVAALLGAAAAGGSVLRRTDTETTASHAVPYALIGSASAVAVAVLALLALRAARVGSLGLRPVEWLAALIVVASVGALLGIARTPPEPTPDDVSPLADGSLSEREQQADRLGDDTRAGPIDLDGDGVPDPDAAGREITALDLDGDGRFEEYLEPCPPGSAEPEQRAGAIAFDVDCDGTAERWLPYDRNIFLEGDDLYEPRPPSTVPPLERLERAEDEADERRGDVIGRVLLALLAVAIAIAIVVLILRLAGRRDQDPDDEPEPDRDTPPGTTTDAIERTMSESLDMMLAGPDPRAAICAAYGRLLDGFAEVGLGRRAEEGPEEHMRRCLAGAQVDGRPVQQLVGLFALARFSDHPVDESHRSAAVSAMQEALTSVGRGIPVGAGAATRTTHPGSSR